MTAQKARKEARPPRDEAVAGRLARWLPDPPPDAVGVDQRTTVVFIATIILLVVFQYFGKPESLRGGLAASLQPLYDALTGARSGMAPFAHWAVSSVVLRVLVPFALILFVLLRLRQPRMPRREEAIAQATATRSACGATSSLGSETPRAA